MSLDDLERRIQGLPKVAKYLLLGYLTQEGTGKDADFKFRL